MSERFLHSKIHEVLRQKALVGPFYRIRYPDGAEIEILRDSQPIRPSSVIVRPVDSNFDVSKNTTKYQRERTRWGWELLVNFEEEAVVEEFEASLMSPIYVPADTTITPNLPTFRVELVRTQYNTPPRVPSSPHDLSFFFDIIPGRA